MSPVLHECTEPLNLRSTLVPNMFFFFHGEVFVVSSGRCMVRLTSSSDPFSSLLFFVSRVSAREFKLNHLSPLSVHIYMCACV